MKSYRGVQGLRNRLFNEKEDAKEGEGVYRRLASAKSGKKQPIPTWQPKPQSLSMLSLIT